MMQDEIYSAEIGLFDKMRDVHLSDDLEETLIQYGQSLSSSSNQVEQSRMKAAEVAAALCQLARPGSRLKEVMMQQLSQLRAQERSIPIQQCLDRALRSLGL